MSMKRLKKLQSKRKKASRKGPTPTRAWESLAHAAIAQEGGRPSRQRSVCRNVGGDKNTHT